MDVKGLQICTTAVSEQAAGALADALLQLRYVACVQIEGPLTSRYWWQGAREESVEWRCVMKTRVDLYEEVERIIVELHEYETPEIVAMPIIAGSPEYLAWIEAETGKG
jgi:periplasmic divalent cation tolerance protein